MPKVINEFRGKYYFLSNFYYAPVRVRNLGTLGIHDEHAAPTAEHVFQAMKTRNPVEQEKVLSQLTPGQAKRAGRLVTLREDWEDVKLKVMYIVVRAKFTQSQNADLLGKLLATKDAQLIEGNYWNDTFWGVDLKTGKGENNLGKILMQLRGEI